MIPFIGYPIFSIYKSFYYSNYPSRRRNKIAQVYCFIFYNPLNSDNICSDLRKGHEGSLVPIILIAYSLFSTVPGNRFQYFVCRSALQFFQMQRFERKLKMSHDQTVELQATEALLRSVLVPFKLSFC